MPLMITVRITTVIQNAFNFTLPINPSKDNIISCYEQSFPVTTVSITK